MKRLIFFVIILFSTITNGFQSNIVALVNDEPITRYELETRYRMILLLNDIQDPTDKIKREIYQASMQTLIDEQVLLQHAARLGNVIPEKEIDQSIKLAEERNKFSSGHLSRLFRNNNVDISSLRSQMKSELIKRSIFSHLARSVSVSPNEIDMVILDNASKDANIKGEIFVSLGTDPASLKKMYDLQRKLSRRIKGDEIKPSLYESIAKIIPIDGRLNSYSGTMRSVISDLREGDVSSVFATEEGFKFIHLNKKEIIGVSNEENEYVINFINNKKLSQKAQKYFNDLRKKAYIKILQ